jgi:hypothetical protein
MDIIWGILYYPIKCANTIVSYLLCKSENTENTVTANDTTNMDVDALEQYKCLMKKATENEKENEDGTEFQVENNNEQNIMQTNDNVIQTNENIVQTSENIMQANDDVIQTNENIVQRCFFDKNIIRRYNNNKTYYNENNVQYHDNVMQYNENISAIIN